MSFTTDNGFEAVAAGDEYNASLPGIMAGLLFPHFICTVAVGLRAVCRHMVMRKWHTGDTFITLAWLCATAVVAVYSIAASTRYFQKPFVTDAAATTDAVTTTTTTREGETSQNLESYLMRAYLGLILHQLCLCLTKLSVLAFYLRMFAERPRERRAARATVLWVVAYGLPLLAMTVLQCHPSRGLFFGRQMVCFSFRPLLVASAGLHSATDVWLVLMMVPCVLKLRLPARQKMAVTAVMGMSVFLVAASVLRMVLGLERGYAPTSPRLGSNQAFFVLTILECDIAIICAAAPTLRLLALRYWPMVSSSGRGNMGFGKSPYGWTLGYQQQAAGYVATGAAPTTTTGTAAAATAGMGSERSKFQIPPLSSSSFSFPVEPGPERSMRTTARSERSFRPASDVPSMPTQPMPVLRTPGPRSLRSLLTIMVPRTRGGTKDYSEPEERRGLTAMTRIRDWDNPTPAGMTESQRMSVASSFYFDRYLTTADGYMTGPRGSSTDLEAQDARWTNSQESFVMGMNDPASPTRIRPASYLT